MSGKGGRQCTNSGTNSSGNNYRSYNDGGYTYTNKGSDGATSSSYFNTGHGHAFYSSKGGDSGPAYSFHENQNTGTRTYHSK